ncbi:MAG: AraC family transcriptional regulator [Caldilineaceae bacterium]
MAPTTSSSFVVNPKPTHFNPDQPLGASDWISARGVGLIPVYFPGRHSVQIVPELPWDHLTLHVQYPTKQRGKLVHKYDTVSKPGDIYIIPRGVPTEWHNVDGCELLLIFLWHSLLTDVALTVFDLDPARVQLRELVATPDPLLQAIGQTLLNEEQSTGLGDRLYTESLLNTLVLHLFRHHITLPRQPPPCKGGLAPTTLRHVLAYIHENLAHDLSLAALAKEANLSTYHFAHLFRASVGESVHQFVIRQRVEAAKQLLNQGTLTLPEVAVQVGFADQSHLGRHCKALLGATPKMLRKERKNLPNPDKNQRDATK